MTSPAFASCGRKCKVGFVFAVCCGERGADAGSVTAEKTDNKTVSAARRQRFGWIRFIVGKIGFIQSYDFLRIIITLYRNSRMMDRKQIVFDYLGRYALRYDYYEHPAPRRSNWPGCIGATTARNTAKIFFSAIIKATGITSSFSTATEIWRSAISNAGCDRESSRSLPNSGWNGIWDSVRVPYRRSD